MQESEEKDSRIKLVLDDRISCHEPERSPVMVISEYDEKTGALKVEGWEKQPELVLSARPRDILSPEFRSLIGHYGWDWNELIVFENDDGGLVAIMEWFFFHPLTHTRSETKPGGRTYHWFSFPKGAMYGEEGLKFKCINGRAVYAKLPASVCFLRRAMGDEPGLLHYDRIRVLTLLPSCGIGGGVKLLVHELWGGRTVEEVRKEAVSMTPPCTEGTPTHELVQLTKVVPSLELDIRYATENNFLSTKVYTLPGAFMQRVAAEALGITAYTDMH